MGGGGGWGGGMGVTSEIVVIFRYADVCTYCVSRIVIAGVYSATNLTVCRNLNITFLLKM